MKSSIFVKVLRGVEVFDCIYIVELLLRIGLERWLFFSACANWFDTSLVVAAAFDIGLFLFADADDSMMAVAFARAVNTLRAIRLLRIFRLFRGFWVCRWHALVITVAVTSFRQCVFGSRFLASLLLVVTVFQYTGHAPAREPDIGNVCTARGRHLLRVKIA